MFGHHTETATDGGRLPQLDGLRAIAVGAVILEHSLFGARQPNFFDVFAPGSFGVRLFFVLSGFLITGILLDGRSAAARNGVSRSSVWLAFYARRALRIFPLAYVAIALVTIAGDAVVRSQLGWYVTYLPNVLAARNETFDASTIRHFWSLAVEEQFYLLWPALVLLLPIRLVCPAIVGGIATSFVVRTLLVADGRPLAAYVLLPSRMDALLVGALLAWLVRQGWPLKRTAGYAAAIAAALACIQRPELSETVGILVSVAAVAWAASGSRGIVGSLLGHPVPRWIGSISYGIYVYHFLIANVARMWSVQWAMPALSPPYYGWKRLAWMLATTIPAAAVSWYVMEKPLNDLKRHFPYATPRRRVALRPTEDVAVTG